MPLPPAEPDTADPADTTRPHAPARIVVLLSGRGSNLGALLERCSAERWPAAVAGVVSNRPEAAGLALARAHGLPTAVVDHRAFGGDAAGRAAFDAALADAVDAFAPDLVVLAGFMRILGADFVRRHEGRLLNIHPSLLPAFPGLHTHRRALAAGCRFAGATVHLVTAELDHGPIVLQAAVPVLPDDDEATLAARVLAVEHHILPTAVRWFVTGRVALGADGRVRQLDGEPQGLFEPSA